MAEQQAVMLDLRRESASRGCRGRGLVNLSVTTMSSPELESITGSMQERKRRPVLEAVNGGLADSRYVGQ
jgi:hypothetical protein